MVRFFKCSSKRPSSYTETDVSFLQLVANQEAVEFEKPQAFQEIQAPTDKLSKENVYLENQVRAEHNFGDIVRDSAALRRVLNQVETVAPMNGRAAFHASSSSL